MLQVRAKVLDWDLQQQVMDEMSDMKPLPSIYSPDFIASNQADRADNIIPGTMSEQLTQIRKDIGDFKLLHGLERVIVVWTANTERYADVLILFIFYFLYLT